jgi:hypothetical protein
VRQVSLLVTDERYIQETATYDTQRVCTGAVLTWRLLALWQSALATCTAAVLFPVWRTAVRCCCIVLSHRTASVPL